MKNLTEKELNNINKSELIKYILKLQEEYKFLEESGKKILYELEKNKIDNELFVKTFEENKRLRENENYNVVEINDLLKKLDDLIKKKEKQKEKQELIDYLKEQISNLHWEMSELSLGMCDTKFQRGKLSAYEEILKVLDIDKGEIKNL